MQWLGLEAQNFEYGGQGSDLTGSKRTSVRGDLGPTAISATATRVPI